MLKTRIILIISAAVLVLVIFNLPKVVVDNDQEATPATTQTSENTGTSTNVMPPDAHAQNLPEEATRTIQNFKEKLSDSDNIEKNIIFADSLASLYLDYNKYDSAAKYFEIIAQKNPDAENWQRTGDAYYEAFNFAMGPEKRSAMAAKAREYFEKILEESPGRLDVKNKLAMTHLSGSNPMKGIMMLREILQQDPENERALFNLGALSMQSNQYDKAVERFEHVIKINPENLQAQFFLGVSYLEAGDREKAKEQLELVKKLDSNPEVQAAADSYLEKIK